MRHRLVILGVLVLVASALGVALAEEAASAHVNAITVTEQCNNDGSISFFATVENDHPLVETVTVSVNPDDSGDVDLNGPATIAALGSETYEAVYPVGGFPSSLEFKADATWSDGFHRVDSATYTVAADDCSVHVEICPPYCGEQAEPEPPIQLGDPIPPATRPAPEVAPPAAPVTITPAFTG